MPRLLVVRHGQTDFNAESRYQGSIDIPLNATGVQQAEEAAQQLRAIDIDIVVSSPLRRALGTAEIIARSVRCDVEILGQFAERRLGVYEGLTSQEVQDRYPDLWTRIVTRQINDAPPGGETILEVGHRVFEGLNQLKQRHGDKTVLLVTHGLITRMLHGIFNRVSDEQFYSYLLGNCEIVEYSLT